MTLCLQKQPRRQEIENAACIYHLRRTNFQLPQITDNILVLNITINQNEIKINNNIIQKYFNDTINKTAHFVQLIAKCKNAIIINKSYILQKLNNNTNIIRIDKLIGSNFDTQYIISKHQKSLFIKNS